VKSTPIIRFDDSRPALCKASVTWKELEKKERFKDESEKQFFVTGHLNKPLVRKIEILFIWLQTPVPLQFK
jgi:hypothetical protein